LRILIIDDDPHPSPGHSNPGAAAVPAVDGIDLNGSVMHEYQVATPLPIPVDSLTQLEEQSDAGSADVTMVRELIARVQELLHRTRRLPATATAGWNGTIRFGSVSVEPATQTVLRDGQPVRLTHTEFRLLLALMRRRGAIASRMELLGEVWGAGTEVSRRAVDTHIARLRRKLEEDPGNPRHILTALAWGYRFRP
jgi:transcriptional regulator